MGNRKPFAVLLMCCLLAVVAGMPAEHVEPVQDSAISTYMVHVAYSHSPRPTRSTARLTRAYTSFLHDTLPAGISAPAPSIIYSYAHAMTGFAARLTARQAAHLEAQPSVLAVIPDRLYELQTTMSSSFLGLEPSSPLIMESSNATDVVIGVIESGVYPKDRASFAADPWMKPPPPSFRGGCVSTPDFNATEYCNNKLVGAKFFHKGHVAMMSHVTGSAPASWSPLDYNGHGTHVASTAAGAPVQNANLFRFARGVARGTASGARIASYNVCGGGGRCLGSDIMAGVDEAIADKVDVLSISIGGSHRTLYDDPTMVASFRAIREGIFVSTAGMNDGPGRATVHNLAPWVCTVGASSMDREFRAPVSLGNGKRFTGYSLYSGADPYGTMQPLVYGGDVGSEFCEAGKLDASKVKGKIVLCIGGGVAKGMAVKQAGGVGAICASSADYGKYASAYTHILPAVTVRQADAMEIKEYSKTPNPVARISYFKTVKAFVTPPSPRVAPFSGRAPNRLAQEILKPDIIAPGVEIIAAWTGEASPSQLDSDTRRVKFNIMSGTSMATPQVSGIAAMLKAARPKWSPAAIKSALMTTAYNVDNSGGGIIRDMYNGEEAGPFQLGAGHVDPNRALDPGLVYDAGEDDYISFLCAMGYTPGHIAIFTGDRWEELSCWKRKNVDVGDHNYPAFSVAFKSYGEKVTHRRVVRNVGSNVNAVYTHGFRTSPSGVIVSVSPSKLVFDAEHQTQEYSVTFSLKMSAATANNDSPVPEEASATLVWTDGEHKVASPMVFTWPAPTVAVATM